MHYWNFCEIYAELFSLAFPQVRTSASAIYQFLNDRFLRRYCWLPSPRYESEKKPTLTEFPHKLFSTPPSHNDKQTIEKGVEVVASLP